MCDPEHRRTRSRALFVAVTVYGDHEAARGRAAERKAARSRAEAALAVFVSGGCELSGDDGGDA
jgi:hypothetical protein